MAHEDSQEGIRYLWLPFFEAGPCSACGESIEERQGARYLVDLVRSYADHAVWCTCARHACQQKAKRAWREVMHLYPKIETWVEVRLLVRGIFPDHPDYAEQRDRVRRHPSSGTSANDLQTCDWIGGSLTPDHPMFQRIHHLFDRRYKELLSSNEGGFHRGPSGDKLKAFYAAEIARGQQLLADYEAGLDPDRAAHPAGSPTAAAAP
jgi:hypothetical protein